MTTKTFTVPAIHCTHCTHTIELEVGELAGVSSVKADAQSKEVTIKWGIPASWNEIQVLLEEINFPPAG